MDELEVTNENIADHMKQYVEVQLDVFKRLKEASGSLEGARGYSAGAYDAYLCMLGAIESLKRQVQSITN